MSRGVTTRITYRGPGGASSIDKWVARYAKELPGKILHPALRDASKRTVMKTRKRAVRRVATATKVPVRVVRNRTAFVKGGLGTTRRAVIGLWWYSRGISLPVLKAKQLKKGVRAGKHFFKGAFLAKSSANDQVHGFKRQGRARLPLVAQKVHFENSGEFGRVLRIYGRTFMPRRFRDQVRYRIEKTKWGRGSTRSR